MSNIYIQEPPALGKVLLKTTVGDIDLELWTKEAPKACRNFIQLSMEGYYNGTIFHRVVPDFIVQGGDPKGDGTGGESIYGAPFKDEFHTRLRFNRRGLVAMANAGKDDNGSQFFFTLNTTPELQNKHTIFGKVTGETVYNMLKLAEGDIDHNERPAYPHKITGCQVLINPFEDIKPRIKEQDEVVQPKKKKEKGVKNFGLLSFGMEAEEEEDQSTEFRGKPKSTHDLLDDPKLSKDSAVEVQQSDGEEDDEEKLSDDNIEEEPKMTVESVRNKMLQKKADLDKRKKIVQHCGEDKSDEEIEEYYLGKDKEDARKKKLDDLRKEVKKLKKEMSQKNNPESDDDKKDDKKKQHHSKDNEMVQQYEDDQEKYRKNMEKIPKKGASREEHKAWTKRLYENTGIYPDNYTDPKFLEEMKKNINIRNDTFLQSAFGSLRITQRLSTIVIFSLIFTYLYNEWISAKTAFGLSCLATFLGYLLFLLVIKFKKSKSLNVLEHLKMVLIYLVFGYLFSPILHTLTDTVSTDTIFAATIFMMVLHMIFSDYGISVAVVSNSLSINSAIFGSICLASRLSTPFCAFVLLTVSVQAFVLSPILVRLVWDSRYYVIVFSMTVMISSILLWNVSQTMFFFFILTLLFVNVYCPYLFIKWQKYKDNIYGPWDEAVVHDADDISNCVGVK